MTAQVDSTTDTPDILEKMDRSQLSSLAINEQGFAFNPESGESFTLNIIAREIIEAIKAGIDSQSIVMQLVETYDVNFEEAYADVIDFMEHLKMYGLLK
ncbi:PqqD family protein [Magnetococcales bacterium HHB-1]